MSDLFLVQGFDANKAPLMLELPVEPTCAPYLVTSTRSLLWIPNALKNSKVRVATRKASLEDIYSESVNKIYDLGKSKNWGNGHPCSLKGLDEAISYLKYYGLNELEILSSEQDSLNIFPLYKQYEVKKASWVTGFSYLIVPKDRSYLGTALSFKSGIYSVLVHNPSRGISIVENL